MNLQAFLSRGAAHAPKQVDPVTKAAEDTRVRWLDALMADETRAWMGIGEADRGVVEGLTTMLAIAGFAHVYDTRNADTPDIRIIRGAISAAEQCMKRGGVVQVEDARAFSSAATRARAIIESASVDAIIHAATQIRATVGL
jgi:hypothetical protein